MVNAFVAIGIFVSFDFILTAYYIWSKNTYNFGFENIIYTKDYTVRRSQRENM